MWSVVRSYSPVPRPQMEGVKGLLAAGAPEV